MKKVAIAVSIAAALLLQAQAARADELKVLSAAVLRTALPDAGANFERMTGVKLAITYDTAGVLKTKLEKGEPADVVILPKPDLAALVKARKIAADSVRAITRINLAIAVRKGAPKPEIGSVPAVKKALLDAKSIAYFDPKSGAASGPQVARAIARLGIGKQAAGKTTLWKSQEEELAEKNADVIVGFAPGLMAVTNYELVGPLPAQLQDPEHSTFAAGAATKSADLDTAKDLVRVLASPESLGAFKAKGMAPP